VNIGDLVKYCGNERSLTGVVKTRRGTKWFDILWSDDVVLSEHIDDLQVLSGATPRKKKRESK